MVTRIQIQNLQIHYAGNNYILWIHILVTTEEGSRLEHQGRIGFSVPFCMEKNNTFFFRSINHISHLSYKEATKLPPNLVDNGTLTRTYTLAQLVQKVKRKTFK